MRAITKNIGVARGCSGCTCAPQAVKKIRRNLQGKFVSAPQHTKYTPLGESKSQFLAHFCWARDIWRCILVLWDCVLKATTKKSCGFQWIHCSKPTVISYQLTKAGSDLAFHSVAYRLAQWWSSMQWNTHFFFFTLIRSHLLQPLLRNPPRNLPNSVKLRRG